MQADSWIPDSVEMERPSTARMYDYLLGGGHNFAIDRAMVDKLLQMQPRARHGAMMNRAFLRRAVLFLIDQGIRQFLDLGSGIPTVGNVHEVAQQADPQCRVVYVDIEPVAVAHSHLLLEGNERVRMLQADVASVSSVLEAEETRSVLDFDEPIGILAVTIGHYISPERDPVGVFRAYRDAVVPGSYLAITHMTQDFDPEMARRIAELTRQTPTNAYPRTRAEILELFADFELVEPGLVPPSRWRPDRARDLAVDFAVDGAYAGVGRKLP